MLRVASKRTTLKWRKRASVLRRAAPPKLASNAPGPLGPIWIFWAQGLGDAPYLIRRCVESVRAFAGDRQVHLLTADNWSDFAELPPVFHAKREQMGWTKFANGLRLALLIKHGGTWFDATVLQVAPMPPAVLEQDLALPGRPNISDLANNWFVHARADHPFLKAWLDAVTAYWELDLARRPYRHMHYLLEALVAYDAGFATMFDAATELVDGKLTAQLFRAAKRQGDAASLDELARKSWMHKLNRKDPAGPVLTRWLERRAEGGS